MDKTKSVGSGLGKWVAGIMAAVIGGLLLAKLTPLVTGGEKTPTTAPTSSIHRQVDIKILDLPERTLASDSEEKTMQLSVYNEGNTAAERCQVHLNDENGQRLTNSDYFGLIAGDTKTISLTIFPFDKSLELEGITLTVEAVCSNGHSPSYNVRMVILP